MSDLVERYVNEVINYLPVDEQAELKKELMSNISDEIMDEDDEEEIKGILNKFGHPRKLASQYMNNPCYLIGPELFNVYLRGLKVGIIIALIVAACVGTISVISDIIANPMTAEMIIESILYNSVGRIFDFIKAALFWVTVGFVIYEKSQSKRDIENWNCDELPLLSEQEDILTDVEKKKKISRVETVVEMIVEAVFLAFFIYVIVAEFPLAWIFNGTDFTSYTIFNIETLRSLLWMFILPFILTTILNIVKLYYGRWNVKLMIVNAFVQVINAIIGVAFFMKSDLIDPIIINVITQNSEFTFVEITNGFSIAVYIIIAVIVMAAIGSIAISINKVYFTGKDKE